MHTRRVIGNAVAMLFLAAGTVLPDSWLADGFRYVAFSYISVDILLRARAGYRRRLPYWTSDSWRRFLVACSVPLGAFVIMALMMVAIEWKLPAVGASRSTVRAFWAGGTVVFMLIGALGLVSVIEWLHKGDPSLQFTLPRWLAFGSGRSD